MIIYNIIQTTLLLVPLLISIAFFTLAERKIMGSIQRRKGPSITGISGVLQPLADGLKLILKELMLPYKTNLFLFILAPISTLFLSFIAWLVIPFNIDNLFINMDLSLLYLLVISSMSVYSIILAGWSSNSKYAFLGALRSVAQMISYEISISFIILPIIVCSGSLNLMRIIEAQQHIWYIVPFFPLAALFWISILAETNRAPFDLPEAEAEIVAGYNIEYSGILFAMFFLSEYSNILLMCSLFVIFFFGGWLPIFHIFSPEFWFAFKITFFVALFILFRTCLPRYRYDQLMDISWKKILPLTLGIYVYTIGILYTFDGFPI